jgi:hypothetical protein
VEVGVLEYSGGRKSAHSGGDNNCVEVGTFRKSRECKEDCCVSVGTGPGVVGVRDTKQQDKATGEYRGPTLEVSDVSWTRFAARLRSGIDWD